MAGKCSIEGCKRIARCRGYCTLHYKRWKNQGEPLWRPHYPNKGRRCIIRDCRKPACSRGMCAMHYYRLRVHGDPRITKQVSSYNGKKCRIEKCTRFASCQNLCTKHYNRLIKGGQQNLDDFPEITKRQVQLLLGPHASKSKYKGVSYTKKSKKWRATISKGGKSYYLGEFKNEEEAARAYNHAAERFYPAMPKYLNPVS